MGRIPWSAAGPLAGLVWARKSGTRASGPGGHPGLGVRPTNPQDPRAPQ